MERIKKRLLIFGVPTLCAVAVLVLLVTSKTDDKADLGKIQSVYRAMQDYTSGGDLPNIVTLDGQHQSWRVALYPYMINDHFAVWYDTLQPFDSPKNLLATTKTSAHGSPFGECYYTNTDSLKSTQVRSTLLRVTGVGTLGDGLLSRKIERGVSETILLIEHPKSDVLWTSLEDFHVTAESDAEIELWIRESRRIALFANGDIRQLPRNTTPAEFRAMCMIAEVQPTIIRRSRLLLSGN